MNKGLIIAAAALIVGPWAADALTTTVTGLSYDRQAAILALGE